MTSIVGCSESLGVLSCVSIIAQSRVIDKVYLVSRLHKVLCNCYFLSKLLYFLRTPTFSKQLYSFARATFQEDAAFQNSYFATANLGDSQNRTPLRKYFLYIPWSKLLHQNCFLRAAFNWIIYRKMRICSVYGEFNIKYQLQY